MKVSIKYENKEIKKHKDFVDKFINLLQKEYPLKEDLTIAFLNGRKGEMSTGSRRDDHLIKILAKDRLNRDIMRTLAHEWVHEFQMSIQKRKQGPDIGGQNEDEANAFAGQLIKKFEKKYPDLEEIMYENKGVVGKSKLLLEQILLVEKGSIKENLIVEMKKIGIEKLPYSYSSLKRFIDSKTMDIHYNKHYKGYVDKLNDSLKNKDIDISLEDIVRTISKFDNKVRNNAGGAFNHALFWKMLSPKKQLPKGEILKKITQDFGNIKKMKDEFNQAAKDRFGSGWAWLYLTKDEKLKIMSTPNQDNPLMNIVKGGGFPLLGLDVWEHAYYLKYQNKRDEYIKKFWDVVNWEFVNDLFLSKIKKDKKQINEIAMFATPRINKLCNYALKNKIKDSSFCKLKKLNDELVDDYLKRDLDDSIRKLDDFFHRKIVGPLPVIIELSLTHDNPINFLSLMADFIDKPEHKNNRLYKALQRLKTDFDINDVDFLEKLSQKIRATGHAEFESGLEGDFFELSPTKLTLNYRCDEDPKDTIPKLLKRIGSKELTIETLVNSITKCVLETMRSLDEPIKRDVLSKQDLLDPEGNVVIPSSSGLEAKKMDPLVDSYLSEFFAIFKQSSNKELKGEYLDVYNKVIDGVFYNIQNSNEGEEFLNKIREGMSAMIFEDRYVVPSEYIDLYWSNKGQRGCEEKRLAIRFRINPDLTELNGYKFVDSETLVPSVIKIVSPRTKKIVCP